MTKKEILSWYKNSVQAVDKTARYHDNVIAIAVRNAYEQILYDLYAQNPNNLDAYVVTLSNLAITNADRDYATLTCSYVKLPGKASGVRSVRTSDDSIYFMPMTFVEYEMANDFDIFNAGDTVGYAVGQDKVYFHNLPSDWEYTSNTVDIDVVKSFEDYASTDEIVIPNGQAKKMDELVMQHLINIPPKNLLNNNTDQNG